MLARTKPYTAHASLARITSPESDGLPHGDKFTEPRRTVPQGVGYSPKILETVKNAAVEANTVAVTLT
jgi:hypothetical protein